MSDDAAPRLGEILLAQGFLTREALDAALAKQQQTQLPLGAILVDDGLVPAHMVAMALADQRGAPVKSEFGYATGHGGHLKEVPRVEPAPAPAEDPSAPLRAELEQVKQALSESEAARAAAIAAAAPLGELRDRVASFEAERSQLEAAAAAARTEAQEQRERLAASEDRLAASEDERAQLVRVYSPDRHALWLSTSGGYELLERRGPVPDVGSVVELSGPRHFQVARVGPSPFPWSFEACAYLEPLS